MFCFETIRPKHSSLFNGDLSGLDSTKVRRWGSRKWKNTWLFGLCTYIYIEFILACSVGSSTSHDEASSFWPGFLFFAWLNYCRSPLYTFVTRAMVLKFDSGPAQIRTPRNVHILSIGKQRIVLGFQGPIILTPTEFKRKRPNGSTAVGWCDEILISLFWVASYFSWWLLLCLLIIIIVMIMNMTSVQFQSWWLLIIIPIGEPRSQGCCMPLRKKTGTILVPESLRSLNSRWKTWGNLMDFFSTWNRLLCTSAIGGCFKHFVRFIPT